MRTAFTDLVGVEHPLVGFNRSPGVVAEVSKAGALGVLAATAYRPEELDAQLTWIEEQIGGRPYGVDLLILRSSPTATRPISSQACARRFPTSTSGSSSS
jgi:NAD(P)H-dependent flavin oxidoreductase YrpB (nitropropane dioxygenase family)